MENSCVGVGHIVHVKWRRHSPDPLFPSIGVIPVNIQERRGDGALRMENRDSPAFELDGAGKIDLSQFGYEAAVKYLRKHSDRFQAVQTGSEHSTESR